MAMSKEEYVFGAGGKPLGSATMLKILRREGIGSTVHGFRSSFRQWCQAKDVRLEVAEAALAHRPSEAVLRATRGRTISASVWRSWTCTPTTSVVQWPLVVAEWPALTAVTGPRGRQVGVDDTLPANQRSCTLRTRAESADEAVQ